MMKKRQVLLLPALFCSVSMQVFTLDVPRLRGRINDYANLLSSETEAEMEAYLKSIEESNGAQIALLTITSLEGDSLERYSLEVAETWELGSAEKDDGVLLLVALSEKKIRIEVGYGLEDSLTDATSGFIIREEIVPQFQRGNFEGGITQALRAIGGIVTGEEPITGLMIPEITLQSEGSDLKEYFGPIIFLLILISLSNIINYGRLRRRGISPWRALFFGFLISGMNSYRSGGSYRGGGFGGGGFGGGGFSGGGGGFGGGGSSGGW